MSEAMTRREVLKTAVASPLTDKLQEGLNKAMKTCVEPAKRGDSIKPGVERSGTPGSLEYK